MGCGASADRGHATTYREQNAWSDEDVYGDASMDAGTPGSPCAATIGNDSSSEGEPIPDWVSNGHHTDEPGEFSQSVSRKARVLTARLLRGVNDDIDQYAEEMFMDTALDEGTSHRRVRSWLRRNEEAMEVASTPTDAAADAHTAPSFASDSPGKATTVDVPALASNESAEAHSPLVLNIGDTPFCSATTPALVPAGYGIASVPSSSGDVGTVPSFGSAPTPLSEDAGLAVNNRRRLTVGQLQALERLRNDGPHPQ